MSQHSYDAKLPDGTPVQITAGWDEAMQWLFLDVEGPTDDKRTDEEGYLYSSLASPSMQYVSGANSRSCAYRTKIPPFPVGPL